MRLGGDAGAVFVISATEALPAGRNAVAVQGGRGPRDRQSLTPWGERRDDGRDPRLVDRTAGEAVDQRRVQGDELPPGVPVLAIA